VYTNYHAKRGPKEIRSEDKCSTVCMIPETFMTRGTQFEMPQTPSNTNGSHARTIVCEKRGCSRAIAVTRVSNAGLNGSP
jgi:hypothetical protein